MASAKFWLYLQVSLATGLRVGLYTAKHSLASTVVSTDDLHAVLLAVLLADALPVLVCLPLVLHFQVAVSKSFPSSANN